MPFGRMTPQQIEEWTAAIDEEKTSRSAVTLEAARSPPIHGSPSAAATCSAPVAARMCRARAAHSCVLALHRQQQPAVPQPFLEAVHGAFRNAQAAQRRGQPAAVARRASRAPARRRRRDRRRASKPRRSRRDRSAASRAMSASSIVGDVGSRRRTRAGGAPARRPNTSPRCRSAGTGRAERFGAEVQCTCRGIQPEGRGQLLLHGVRTPNETSPHESASAMPDVSACAETSGAAFDRRLQRRSCSTTTDRSATRRIPPDSTGPAGSSRSGSAVSITRRQRVPNVASGSRERQRFIVRIETNQEACRRRSARPAGRGWGCRGR